MRAADDRILVDGEGCYIRRIPSEGLHAFTFHGPYLDRPVPRAADDRFLMNGEGEYRVRMPFEGPYAFPFESP